MLKVVVDGGAGRVTFLDQPLKQNPDLGSDQETHRTIYYRSVPSEITTALEAYLSPQAVLLRDWLLSIDGETWTDGTKLPVIIVGWPVTGPFVRCASPKQAAAALRKWFPMRDYEGEDVEPPPLKLAGGIDAMQRRLDKPSY